ncbi:hypothetical protein SAMN05192559_101399 [Halobacillus karajensis]|uniref:Integral membrane protein n=1 Tax=Halobacillus karajensis TaxID=195088 RepID=A0A059NWR5_9BACI|nr:hypothetical protein [Halobacillus karajensis]CDQ18962.1 hypothetical protein BN982_01243 [Halobacillus karajensis]CDQ22964.1 hypothetical protein BN983_01183 [Halobacillus karajensis]CDQ26447.1 hypothetical protein BN981_00664 [Halobacillus karajensis]SEH43836.1 hypothetical protein SAMN05192559_101399 [Halobacillus karajensis]
MDKPKREPIKNGKLWIVFGVLLAFITPWYFPTSFGEILIYGIPLWALVIIFASLLLSAFLSYVLKYHWMLEEEEEEKEAEKKGAR